MGFNQFVRTQQKPWLLLWLIALVFSGGISGCSLLPEATGQGVRGSEATASGQRRETARPTRVRATPRPSAEARPTPGGEGASAQAIPGFETITPDELPAEGRYTLQLIAQGGPFPYRQDGTVFQNRERLLPRQPRGYYREYTVETLGENDRGARRLVVGAGGEIFYTADHYASFVQVLQQ